MFRISSLAISWAGWKKLFLTCRLLSRCRLTISWPPCRGWKAQRKQETITRNVNLCWWTASLLWSVPFWAIPSLLPFISAIPPGRKSARARATPSRSPLPICWSASAAWPELSWRLSHMRLCWCCWFLWASLFPAPRCRIPSQNIFPLS